MPKTFPIAIPIHTTQAKPTYLQDTGKLK